MNERRSRPEDRDHKYADIDSLLSYATSVVNGDTTPPEQAIKSSAEMARKGYVAFVTAGRTYPASVIAQGAYIAYSCSMESESPGILGHALLKSSDLVKQIMGVAERAHSHANKDVLIQGEAGASEVIEGVFTWAQMMTVLAPEQSAHILNQYTQLRAEGVPQVKIDDTMQPSVLETIASQL